MASEKKIKQLVLDAGPLITQSSTYLQQYAQEFYTTPGVHAELKDEHARNQLLLWNDNLKIRHPKFEYIKKVESFAKLTGDFAVLSANDIHIIALAYELEVEQNGVWRLRKYPGEKIDYQKRKPQNTKDKEESKEEVKAEEKITEGEKTVQSEEGEQEFEPKKKPRRRGGKKQREKRQAQLQKELDEEENDAGAPTNAEDAAAASIDAPGASNASDVQDLTQQLHDTHIDSKPVDATDETDLSADFNEDEDDGDWITPDNLQEEMLKDNNEEMQETKAVPFIKVALSTGDFACQNVTMQIGINLMNSMSGKQIKRIRNYMYRCHACFRLTPMPKSGKPKHFCPKCGGDTLLRCAVSIDTVTGRVTPHLKANFQWINRGNKYSLPSPLSKNQRKLQGNSGYQHNKENRHKTLQNPLLLREDQKEYQKAVKDEDWQRRKNEKMLEEWVGGGSADNYISPFNAVSVRPSGVRVGKSRYVNSSKKTR